MFPNNCAFDSRKKGKNMSIIIRIYWKTRREGEENTSRGGRKEMKQQTYKWLGTALNSSRSTMAECSPRSVLVYRPNQHTLRNDSKKTFEGMWDGIGIRSGFNCGRRRRYAKNLRVERLKG
ncbi:hypothetical protein Zmor_017968 [Zophobas morio]|uniref:Uncharacterized protein n=1 Tax=Zophobas morio TaxID=2755281 RepID=A0AA38IB46_9CUCU|nr:hypothetical protein Zmor_017968 [Zophobas morio]